MFVRIKVERVSGIASHAPSSARYYQTGPREQRPQTPQFDREFDLKEEIEMPSPQSRAKQETPRGSAFGDWDIRRENIVRQSDTSAGSSS